MQGLRGHRKVTEGCACEGCYSGNSQGTQQLSCPKEMVQVVAGCSVLSLMGNVTLFYIKVCASHCSQRKPWEGAGSSEKTPVSVTFSPSDGSGPVGGWRWGGGMQKFTFREFKDIFKYFLGQCLKTSHTSVSCRNNPL